MKRLFALLLVVAMLLSLCVLPASAAEQSEMSVDSFYTFTSKDTTTAGITIGEPKEKYEAGDLLAVKVKFRNADAKADYIKLMSIEMVMEYDSSVMEPYHWKYRNDIYGYAYFIDGFMGAGKAFETETGKVKISGASSEGTYVDKNQTVDVAYYLFKIKSDVEAGDAEFTLNLGEIVEQDDEGNATRIQDSISVKGSSVPVNGNPPAINKVIITPADTGYASGAELALKAESGSGKNITSLVKFKVQKNGVDYPTNAGLTIDGAKLKVESTGVLANAGTYTVVAESNGTDCTGSASAEFKITQKTITAPTVTIVGFGKGAAVGDVKYSANDLNAVSSWYEGEGDPSTLTPVSATDKFKADTTYTLVLTLTPANDNYVLDPDTTVTVKNFGEDRTVALKNGVAVVTAKTAAKTGLTVKLVPQTTPDTPTWNMTLSQIGFKADSWEVVTNDADKKTVTGHFEWVKPEQTLGKPTVYPGSTENKGRAFTAKFIPDDKENYAEVEVDVYVHVHKLAINIESVTEWNHTSLKYNGSEQTVELVIPETLEYKDQIAITYTGNKGTNVGSYNATATFGVKDDVHYMIYNSNKERTLSWEIIPGDLTPTANPVKSVRYGIKTVMVYPSDLGLPSGLTVTATPDNALVTAAAANADGSVTLTLRDTTVADADVTTGKVTLIYSSDNYNSATVELTVKIIDKTEDRETLKVKVPASVEYGMGISPDVSETKPAASGDVAFTYYNEAGETLAAGSLATAPVGKYKVVAVCEDENTIYIGEAEFEIVAREIKAEDVVLGSNLTYTGNELTQTVTVTVGGKKLTKDTDYTVTGLTGTEPGDYTVTVTGKDNYKGKVEKTFTIGKATIPESGITFDAGPYGYTGEKWEPEVTVSFNGTPLTAGTDYTVSYEDNINAGTAKVIITGTGAHFTGTTEKPFTIEKASLSGCTIAPIKAVTYNAKAQTPALTVAKSARTLQLGTDYEVVYTNNTDAGTANVTVKGTGNFKDTETTTFTINKADLTLNDKTLSSLYTETDPKTEDLSSVGFCAGETETGFSIKLTAVEGGDDIFAVAPAVVEGENKITFRLKNEVGAATFTVTVTPVSSNYKVGKYDLTIEANEKTNVSGRITFESGSAVYTGSGIKYEKATISGLSGSMRYSYTPDSATGASLDTAGLPLTVGTYTVTATYSDASSYGYKTATFTITKATPTGTPSFTKIETSGKTLADTKLTVGTIRPAGTIAWDLPATTEVEANKEYTWIFTPTDTHNYKPLTGRLTPYVVSDMPYLPGVIGNTGSFSFRDVSRLDYFYDAVKWASENGIASGTSNYTFSPDAVCTRAQTVTFLWRAAGSPMPRYRVSPFTDVNAYDYYYNAVLWAVEQGITTGLTATTFGPDETVTRGQVATFLYRAASAAKPNTFNPFTDVKATAYNYNAILWAYDNRITTGTSTTTFSPDASCTRAQIVTFLYRYYQGR